MNEHDIKLMGLCKRDVIPVQMLSINELVQKYVTRVQMQSINELV